MLHECQHAFQPDSPKRDKLFWIYPQFTADRILGLSLTLLITEQHTRNVLGFSRTSMTAKLLDGASVARAIKDEVASEVVEYSLRVLRPGLAAVVVGNDTASHIYV